MGIADGMKDIAENIIASYNTRVKALDDLVDDTQRILADARKAVKEFASNRKAMGEAQVKELANYVSDLSKTIGNMLKGFRNDLKQVSANRAKMADELKAKLVKDARDLKNEVKKKLKEFSESHSVMTEALRKDLTKFVKNVASDVKNILDGARKLVSEYSADMKKAKKAWADMSSTLGKARNEGVMPTIEAGEKAPTVEAPTRKRKRKKKK